MTIDRQLQDAIRVLLDTRSTVSINEAAKHVGGPRWRSLAVPARRVATQMVQAGEIEVTSVGTGAPAELLRNKNSVRIRRAR